MRKRIVISVLLCLCLGLCATPWLYAAEEERGVIDWVGGVITATGSGTSSKPSFAQAKLMARRAAVVDAQRNLLETVKGVKVDSQTTVENFMVTQDIIRTHIAGFVKGAHITKESFEKQPDGSYLSTVEMRICINRCKDSATSLVQALTLDKKKDDQAAPPQLPPPPPAPPVAVPPPPPPAVVKTYPYDTTKPVTGIVLNLEGRMFERVIMPVIVTAGQDKAFFTVYSAKSVKPKVIRTHGIVRYTDSVEQAMKNEYLGRNVMVISAEDVTNDKMILIKLENAKLIQETNRHGNDYLADAKIVISSN